MALKELWSRPGEWKKSNLNVEKKETVWISFLEGRTVERSDGGS